MTTKEFMAANLVEVQEIINELPATFKSHEFIETFSKRFQHGYIRMLNLQTEKYPDNPEPFQAIHAQIGRFLASNQDQLSISQQGKKKSDNIFGKYSDNEVWNKI